jgi:hypothetical protein
VFGRIRRRPHPTDSHKALEESLDDSLISKPLEAGFISRALLRINNLGNPVRALNGD